MTWWSDRRRRISKRQNMWKKSSRSGRVRNVVNDDARRSSASSFKPIISAVVWTVNYLEECNNVIMISTHCPRRRFCYTLYCERLYGWVLYYQALRHCQAQEYRKSTVIIYDISYRPHIHSDQKKSPQFSLHNVNKFRPGFVIFDKNHPENSFY